MGTCLLHFAFSLLLVHQEMEISSVMRSILDRVRAVPSCVTMEGIKLVLSVWMWMCVCARVCVSVCQLSPGWTVWRMNPKFVISRRDMISHDIREEGLSTTMRGGGRPKLNRFHLVIEMPCWFSLFFFFIQFGDCMTFHLVVGWFEKTCWRSGLQSGLLCPANFKTSSLWHGHNYLNQSRPESHGFTQQIQGAIAWYVPYWHR